MFIKFEEYLNWWVDFSIFSVHLTWNYSKINIQWQFSRSVIGRGYTIQVH